ncbi:hypothetical protein J2W42_004241 [Rhizobium tibeticum]|nr:hypothetical protein [Rhizobium tibeticum]
MTCTSRRDLGVTGNILDISGVTGEGICSRLIGARHDANASRRHAICLGSEAIRPLGDRPVAETVPGY